MGTDKVIFHLKTSSILLEKVFCGRCSADDAGVQLFVYFGLPSGMVLKVKESKTKYVLWIRRKIWPIGESQIIVGKYCFGILSVFV